jgi:hypothetical protein
VLVELLEQLQLLPQTDQILNSVQSHLLVVVKVEMQVLLEVMEVLVVVALERLAADQEIHHQLLHHKEIMAELVRLVRLEVVLVVVAEHLQLE